MLTTRQKQIYRLVLSGLTNPQVAEELGLSVPAIKHHVGMILSYFGVSSREELKARPSLEVPATQLVCPFCLGKNVDPEGWRAGDGRQGPACDDCGASAESVEIWMGSLLKEKANDGQQNVAEGATAQPAGDS